MRQTLLRILLDETWTFQSDAQVLFVGVGWLLVPWLLYGVIRLWLSVPGTRGLRAENVPPLLTWVGVAAAILLVPSFIGPKVAPDGVPVYGYGFMLFVGFAVGGWAAARRSEQAGLGGDIMWDLAVWVFISGIVGARLFYVVQYSDRIFTDEHGVSRHGLDWLKAAINLPDGGLVLYGGVLLGIAAYFVFCRRRKLNPLFMADMVVPSVFIGLAFGRIGCFLNGCCYGDRCELPWAVTFPQGSQPFKILVEQGFVLPEALASIPLHPTQLYSSINAMLLVFLTATYFKHRHRDGAVLAVGWVTYPVTRFVIEYLRGDEMGQFDTSLTISQWVSIGLFCSGTLYALWLSSRPAKATMYVPAVEHAVKAV